MMRNPVSRFAYSRSDLNISRTTMDRPQKHLTSMSAGLLYPLYVDEVLPGDTHSIDTSVVCRMNTPVFPVLDNCYLDTFWFFVPNRLIWDHWKEFMGENPSDPYVSPIEYQVPMLVAPFDDGSAPPVAFKSILDYLGVPAGTSPKEVSSLPVRAFCKVWNEWFRDQNLQNAINLNTGDDDAVYSAQGVKFDNNNSTNAESYVLNAQFGGDLPPVNKYHDYFTSALKQPQKGDPVPIPLSGFAPVYANDLVNSTGFTQNSTKLVDVQGDPVNGVLTAKEGVLSDTRDITADGRFPAYFKNLGANLSDLFGTYASINDLRYAFQVQKFLEADNRGGTRYREILKNHFNVTSPDASIQVPEFLGGKRINLNMSQVLQTSATTDTSPQGNTAAYSLTSDKHSSFTKSFTEHGILLCVGCIRTDHTYTQGIERMFFRKNKFDFYFPEFANISEQPIYNKEIFNGVYDTSSWELADGVFGFQEAWADYRYKPNRVSAEMRSTFPQSLDVWHYGDDYAQQPFLSSEWIRETRSNIDRTLAVNDPDFDQFKADWYFRNRTTRCMPLYSIPGLSDHH